MSTSQPLLIDSHCHCDLLDLDKLGISFDEVITRATQQGISKILSVCVDLEHFPSMLEKISSYPHILASCGIHPLHLGGSEDPELLITYAQQSQVVAIGETGLDYHYDQEHHQQQQQLFVMQMHVAKHLQKPLIIHTRAAQQDTLALIDEHYTVDNPGVIHCFTENLTFAKAVLDRGFYISISGIATFKNAAELREVIKQVPLESLLIETDAPYLTPVPHRGRSNQPAYVYHVAELIAELKQCSIAEVAEKTTENFYQCFPNAR